MFNPANFKVDGQAAILNFCKPLDLKVSTGFADGGDPEKLAKTGYQGFKGWSYRDSSRSQLPDDARHCQLSQQTR